MGGDALEGVEPPVFHFQKQQAPAGMQDDEIRVTPSATNRDVIPDGVVVFQQGFQPLAQAALAGGHVAQGAELGDDLGHGLVPRAGDAVQAGNCSDGWHVIPPWVCSVGSHRPLL